MSNSDFEAPDFYDSSDWAAVDQPRIYKPTPLGRWVSAQAQEGNLVIPKVSRLVPDEEGAHSVMWAEIVSLEGGRCQSCHQVICDCVMDVPIEDVPQARYECEAVEGFLQWGAEMTRHAKGLDAVLAYYKDGTEVLRSIVADLIKDTHFHPEQWTGNRRGGSHSVTGLSYVIGRNRERTLDLVGEIQTTEPVVIEDGEIVRLRAA